ncbi:MAG: AAA family ATPase [Candidatus Kerfeldbacteria bacterium]|nr:AAA family ATPase [Candidatus Kerfeldbacteria bacterium]
MTQDEALTILKTGVNAFLTGEPGSGKTHTINRYISWLCGHNIQVAVTASTGIAATHISGSTIHSWSGIGVKRKLTSRDLGVIASKSRIVQRIRNAHVLIIDEVSMLAAETLTMVETVCRKIRGEEVPFGGLQVILVGDFFQLPPIVSPEPFIDDGQSSLIAPDIQRSRFAFSAPAWQALKPITCYLSEQHRQEDEEFLKFLSALRQGTVTTSHRSLLQTRATKVSQKGATQLFSHNINVDRINDAELKKLSGAEQAFIMTSQGPAQLVAQLQRGCLSPEKLTLKIGAKVMFTKNEPSFKFVNGTLGTVTGFDKENAYPIIKTLTGRNVVAEPMEWSLEDNGKILARITQVPLRLAWAITVHKSQGMSLDAAHMDLSQVFEYGQGYVALSRVRTLAGLTLAGINERALEVHPEIQTKDSEFRRASQMAREQFSRIPAVELLKKQHNFIRLCGGSVSVEYQTKKEKIPGSTYDTTHTLLLQKLSAQAVAKERGLTFGTILNHIEKLVAQRKLYPNRDLAYLKPEPRRYEKIRLAFEKVQQQTGKTRLSRVRETLGDSFSFEELRMARLFLDLN